MTLYEKHGKQFYNKKNQLTVYSLACGYIEAFEANEKTMSLSLDGVFQVKGYDFKNHVRLFWESFGTLTEARKFYAKKMALLK